VKYVNIYIFSHLTWLSQKKSVSDGEKLLTYLNSALKVLSGLYIFPRGTKIKLNFVDQCNQTSHYSHLWNSKVYHRIYNSPPGVPFFNTINSVHIFPPHFLFLLILFSNICLGLPSGSSLSFFQPKSCMRFCSLPNVWHTRSSYSPRSEHQNNTLSSDGCKSCSFWSWIFYCMLPLILLIAKCPLQTTDHDLPQFIFVAQCDIPKIHKHKKETRL
jgi:hypothetical protein